MQGGVIMFMQHECKAALLFGFVLTQVCPRRAII